MNKNLGILGRKVGMTQYFDEAGEVVRCTVVDANCKLLDKRTPERDGYSALVVGIGERKESRAAKAQIGAAKKRGTPLAAVTRELRCSVEDAAKFELGAQLPLDQIFEIGQFVDAQATTRGRGFTGVMRRWNFAGNVQTHGTHEYFRHGGSIGTNMTPGRTLPNLKMPGQYGNEQVTMINLRLRRIDADKNLLFVEGGVPGSKNGIVTVRGAVKKSGGRPKK